MALRALRGVTLTGIRYRFWQLWQAIWGRPAPVDLAAVRQQLGPGLFQLFELMSLPEQDHAVRVWWAVKEKELNNPALETAALLHDVGKTRRPLSILDRVLIVLANKFLPNRVKAWGQGSLSGWRRAFEVAAQHPQWGADMAESFGADPLVVNLVRKHQSSSSIEISGEEGILLQALQLADNEN